MYQEGDTFIDIGFILFCCAFCFLQLFYLVTETYPLGSVKEMRKWAYEIHSTFLCDKSVTYFYSV